MTTEASVTLPDVLDYLRQGVVEAIEYHDHPRLRELQNTLVVLQEAAWKARDERSAALIEDMICAIRDALVGVEWKSDLPSSEAIRALHQGGSSD